jgi:hypothetical protein
VGHLSPSHRVAAGMSVPPDLNQPFAAAQAAWRFYANPSLTLPQLAAPLVELARAAVPQACDSRVLVVLDWCPLHYGAHGSKADRVALAHSKDLGYDLLTALAVSDREGAPLAPLCLELRASGGVYSTRYDRPRPAPSRLDRLGPVMTHACGLLAGIAGAVSAPVFMIDREADSVGHYRAWAHAGRRFVVRADGGRKVLHDGREQKPGEVAGALRATGAFAEARGVEFRGKPAEQFVAETRVVLHRPARTHRVEKSTGKARHRNVAGRPLALRLVVSEVRDDRGKVVARWLLLTNLPRAGGDAAPAATVALWYYWRWRIESYHKLLKGAGQQAECWQQETAAALARRLTVSSMAAVVVWKLARDQRPQAAQFRDVLVRLSGRQTKRGNDARGFTEPALLALLAGLGVLLPMLELLTTHKVQDLRRLVDRSLPGLLRAGSG